MIACIATEVIVLVTDKGGSAKRAARRLDPGVVHHSASVHGLPGESAQLPSGPCTAGRAAASQSSRQLRRPGQLPGSPEHIDEWYD